MSYQNYVAQSAGHQNAGQKKAEDQNSGDYSQYMKEYAGGSQGGDYQQYMKEYAGGAGGSQGGYQQYMKEYANGYDNYSDYQKYIKRYSKKSNQEKDAPRHARDAQNENQLNA